MRQKFDEGEDPLDPENQQGGGGGQRAWPFHFNPFESGGNFHFKFEYNWDGGRLLQNPDFIQPFYWKNGLLSTETVDWVESSWSSGCYFYLFFLCAILRSWTSLTQKVEHQHFFFFPFPARSILQRRKKTGCVFLTNRSVQLSVARSRQTCVNVNLAKSCGSELVWRVSGEDRVFGWKRPVKIRFSAFKKQRSAWCLNRVNR